MPTMVTSNVQEEINRQLLYPSDMLIGLFKGKFGSKTDTAPSGTVEEIEECIAQGKPVMLYFLNYSIERSTATTDILRELTRICEFQDAYKEKGVYCIVDTVEKVCDRLEQDIRYHLSQLEGPDASSSMGAPINNAEVSDCRVSDIKSTTTQVLQRGSQKYEGPGWYSNSIGTPINLFLQKKGIEYTYKFYLTFHENLLLAQGINGRFMNSTVHDIFDNARTYAFNEKYGDYDYEWDIRSLFPKWYEPLKNIIKCYCSTSYRTLSYIDVGGNCGREMHEFFGKKPKKDVTIVDISNEALEKGSEKYQNYTFVQANMEEPYCIGEQFDVCLCLRAIQSTGVCRNDAIIQMTKVIKPNGLIIISIPNGYIGEEQQIVRGLYDYQTQSFSRRKPLELCMKIERKLMDYGFDNTGVRTIDTEILVWGQKTTKKLDN